MNGGIDTTGGKQSYVGGICAYNSYSNGDINRCYNIGMINCDVNYSWVGGIAGLSNSYVNDCYNEGNVIVTDDTKCYVAGIAIKSTYGGARNCYNIGNVQGLASEAYVGGILAEQNCTNCYSLDTITISGTVVNPNNYSTSDQVMKSSEFYETLNTNNVWKYEQDSYPKLDIDFQEEQIEIEHQTITEIEYIEDLIDFSISVNSGNNYDGITVNLMRTLDFLDDESYRDVTTTSYGDLNGDGRIDSIKTELTTGEGFVSIGNSVQNPFSGTFDGNENEIQNLYINKSITNSSKSTNNDIGLFANISDATIKNLGVKTNFHVKWTYGAQNIGGIVGRMACSTMNNCYVTGKMTTENNYRYSSTPSCKGGLIGYAYASKISNCNMLGEVEDVGVSSTYQGGIVGYTKSTCIVTKCCNVGEIKGAQTGGIVAYVDSSAIDDCYNKGYLSNSNTEIINSVGIGGIAYYSSSSIITNCYNEGDISCAGSGTYGSHAGVIVGSGSGTISNCYNLGNIDGCEVGGIAGSFSDGKISNCYNVGNLSSIGHWNRYASSVTYVGGIAGGLYQYPSDACVENCYNTGRIMCEADSDEVRCIVGGIVGNAEGTKYIIACYNTGNVECTGAKGIKVGGILGYCSMDVNNCYNTGSVSGVGSTRGETNSVYVGGLVGDGFATLSNSYNTGDVYGVNRGNDSFYGVDPVKGFGSRQNCYYLDSITINKEKQSNEYMKAVSYDYMISNEFYSDLNVDNIWYHRINDFPKLIGKSYVDNIVESTEITVKNTIKKFKITTEVKNGRGGTITGEGENPYEIVEINHNNQKQINIEPSEGYEIGDISINGTSVGYIVNEDRSYVINDGYFENMQEDKHIVVSFTPSKQTLTINKTDELSGESIEGARFNIEQVEDQRDNINLDYQSMVSSDYEYTLPDENNEIPISDNLIPNGVLHEYTDTTDYTNSFIRMNQYYFPKNGNAYVSDNRNINNSQANSMILLDLRNMSGNYSVVVNASISSEENHDYGYANLLTTSYVPSHTETNGQFIHISGQQSSSDYTIDLVGGYYYYLHFGYYKDSSRNVGNDCFTINSVTLCQEKTIMPCFVKNGNKYVSNNKGFDNTVANSYMPIDLTNINEECIIVVNASISSDYNDYGYATVTESTEAPVYNNPEGRFIYKSGYDTRNYSIVLEGGKMYYLHFGYYKDNQNSSNSDEFTINSINVYKTKKETFYFVNDNGKLISNNQNIDDTTANSYILIDLRDEVGKYNLTVNAEISSSSGDYGYVTISRENIIPEFNNTSGRFVYITGTKNANDYTTTLDGGYLYYLHMGYYKNYLYSSGTDTFTINSIVISPNHDNLFSGEFTTNESGQIVQSVQVGTYTITELEAPEGYTLDPTPHIVEVGPGHENTITITNKHKTGLLVHHYFKDNTKEGDERYTEIKVADDEYQEADLGESYITSPRFDLDNLYLEKDDEGRYVVPENAEGVFGDSLIEVNYYYELKPIELRINHYLEGTRTVLAEEQIEEYDSVLTVKDDGTYEITTEGSYEIDSNENYHNLLDDKYELVRIESSVNPELSTEDTLTFNENAELRYYYRLKEHKITTEVKEHIESRTNEVSNEKEDTSVKGGSISGENDDPYEVVSHESDSTNEITAIPDEGYRILKIILESGSGDDKVTSVIYDEENETDDNEYEITFVKNADGSITLKGLDDTSSNLFTNVTDDKHIIVEFAPEMAKLVVHHYIEGTGEEFGTEPVRILMTDGETEHPDDVRYDFVNEPYATKVSDRANKRYKFISASSNTSGNYADETTHVYYYYNLDDFAYSIHYFYDDVEKEENTVYGDKVRFGEEITEYPDKPEGYVFNRVEPADSSDERKTKLTISENEEDNVINVYYVSYCEITTDVIEHEEKYSDGTTELVKGGTISGEDEAPYEEVQKYHDSTKDIVITPDDGYEIARVTIKDFQSETETELNIDSFKAEDGSITLNNENGYFGNMTSNKHVEVEFRKKTKVVVKYLSVDETDDNGNPLVLAEEVVIEGKQDDEYNTQRKVVTDYITAKKELTDGTEASETYEDSDGTYTKYDQEAEHKMYADTTTIIYWYKKAPRGNIIVRHIEIDESDVKDGLTLDSGKELDVEMYSMDEILDEARQSANPDEPLEVEQVINRKTYTDSEYGRAYISVNGPTSSDDNMQIVSKDDSQHTVIVKEDGATEEVIEVRFYYERQYKITTKVQPHTEVIDGTEESIKGGSITGDGMSVFELVNRMGANAKSIIATPGEKYRIKYLTVNGKELNITDVKDEDGIAKLLAGFFKNVTEDKHIVVEYEKIPARVVVKYLEDGTEKELSKEVEINGLIDDEYKTYENEIEGYEIVKDKYPTNAKGNMTKEDILVIYYYKKIQDTPVQPDDTDKETEHNEQDKKDERAPEQNQSEKNSTYSVKTGDNEAIYLVVMTIASIVMLAAIIAKRF